MYHLELVMRFSKEQFRFYIFGRSKLGHDTTKIHTDLCVVARDIAPSLKPVKCWMEKNIGQRDSFEDALRAGRPASVVNEENAACIGTQIEGDARLTLTELCSHTGPSESTAFRILHEVLGC